MARNGSGVYSLPAGSTVTNGDTSDASDVNTPLQDIETDMNTARPIVAGGTGATSASAARGNFGIGSTVESKSSNYTALLSDRSKLIVGTSNLTLSLTAAATLTDGWYIYVMGLGGVVTIDPDGSETVNGSATLEVADGESAAVFCDGSNFYAAKTIQDTDTLTGFDPTKISEIDASSDTEVDFDLDNSTYTHYRIVVSNLVVGTAGASLRLRTSTDGGSSFDSGASDYLAHNINGSGSSTPTGSGSTAAHYIVTDALGTSGMQGSAEILVHNAPGSAATGFTHSWSGSLSSSFFGSGTGGGQRSDTTAVDAIRLFPSTGNFSGKFTLYGMG